MSSSAKLAELHSRDRQLSPVRRKGHPTMRRFLKWFMYAVLSIVAVVAAFIAFVVFQFVRLDDPAANAAETPEPSKRDLNGARDLAEILEPIRREHKLPALAAAAVKDGRTVALGA